MPTPPQNDLPGGPRSIELVAGRARLETHRTAWERLIETAIEPNAFLEPSFLLPALDAYGDPGAQVALVYAQNRKHPAGQRVLCGLFPLRRRLLGRFADGLWLHAQAFLGTPLVRSDFASETLETLFDWLRAERGDALFGFPKLHAGGPFHRALVGLIQARGMESWVEEQHLRALFRPAASAEDYALRAISRSTRREVRRLSGKLAQTGHLESRVLARDAPDGELKEWIESFLILESRGWKGRRGTAFLDDGSNERFFREALTGAFHERRLVMLRLDLDGQPLAMNCAFSTAGGVGFYFKIAHDESYARYSPGTLLELEFLSWLHSGEGPRWVDSCAGPNHPLIDRIWDDRRPIQSLWVATGRRGGPLALGLLPLARALRQPLKRLRRRKREETS
jgi:CelD/BcsL family acetyltransferase involved in cellulose biosynthesis